ncbi:MAG: transcriptional repressor [Clostridia bacterium]|nr:transcriptional repressor [Clostridia bacterium]
MPKYITKQRKAFLSYLELHPDEPLTAHQITEALQSENISVSAVYRNLCDLEAEGKIRRISRSGSREVYYQYTDADACKACLHLSCKKCGKTFHMGTPSTRLIVQNLAEAEEFAIDKTDTVIYGVCKDCQK